MPEPWEEQVKEMRAKILDLERDVAGLKSGDEKEALKSKIKTLEDGLAAVLAGKSNKKSDEPPPAPVKHPITELIGD